MSGSAAVFNDIAQESEEDSRKRPRIDEGLLRSISPMPFTFEKGHVFDESTSKEMWLSFMARLGTELQSVFADMKWLVMHARPGTAFLTTDAPVTVIRAPDHPRWRGAGFMTPGATTAVPLASKTCLLMTHPGFLIAHVEASKSDVRELNQFVVANRERFVIGRDETHLRSLVQKTRVDRTPKQPLVEISGGRRPKR